MKRNLAVFALAALIGLAPAAVSTAFQGRGGGGGGQQAGQGGGRGGQQPGQIGQGQGQGQQGGAGQADRQRQRIHMDEPQRDQQRDRLRDCDATADQVRQQARTMARSNRFSAGEAVQQRDRLREHVADLERQHARLFEGFTAPQRDQLRDQVRSLDRARDRLRDRMQALDAELAGPNPDGRRFAKRAHEVEHAASDWQKRYRRLGDALGW